MYFPKPLSTPFVFAAVLGLVIVFTSCKKEQQESVELGKDLVAYYQMNLNGLDSSGNGFNPTLPTSAIPIKSRTDGPFDALRFGHFDFVQIPPLKPLSNAGKYSITFWRRYPDGIGKLHTIMVVYNKFQLRFSRSSSTGSENGIDSVLIWESQSNKYILDKVQSGGTSWNHIALTFDGSKTKDQFAMYVNGKFYKYYCCLSSSFPTISNADIFRIGNFDDALDFKFGDLIEMRIYKRVLNQSEITKLASSMNR